MVFLVHQCDDLLDQFVLASPFTFCLFGVCESREQDQQTRPEEFLGELLLKQHQLECADESTPPSGITFFFQQNPQLGIQLLYPLLQQAFFLTEIEIYVDEQETIKLTKISLYSVQINPEH